MSSDPAARPDDDVVFSRSAITSPWGKLTEDVKTHVDENTANLFMRKAARCDMLPGVLLREILYAYVHGHTYSELVAQHRRQQIEAEGPIGGLNRIGEGG